MDLSSHTRKKMKRLLHVYDHGHRLSVQLPSVFETSYKTNKTTSCFRGNGARTSKVSENNEKYPKLTWCECWIDDHYKNKGTTLAMVAFSSNLKLRIHVYVGSAGKRTK